MQKKKKKIPAGGLISPGLIQNPHPDTVMVTLPLAVIKFSEGAYFATMEI